MSEPRGYIVKHPLVLSVALPESDVRALYEWQNGVAREIAADRAKVVAWLREEALRVRRSGSISGPEWCDALRWAADHVQAGEHEETRGGK